VRFSPRLLNTGREEVDPFLFITEGRERKKGRSSYRYRHVIEARKKKEEKRELEADVVEYRNGKGADVGWCRSSRGTGL